jgi:uncharacterized protein (DUF1778 family)
MAETLTIRLDQRYREVLEAAAQAQGTGLSSFVRELAQAPENGAEATSWALAQHVTTVSLRRVELTRARIKAEQLANLRQRAGLVIQAEPPPVREGRR